MIAGEYVFPLMLAGLALFVGVPVIVCSSRDSGKSWTGTFKELWPIAAILLFCAGLAWLMSPTAQALAQKHRDAIMLTVFVGGCVLIGLGRGGKLPRNMRIIASWSGVQFVAISLISHLARQAGS